MVLIKQIKRGCRMRRRRGRGRRMIKMSKKFLKEGHLVFGFAVKLYKP